MTHEDQKRIISAREYLLTAMYVKTNKDALARIQIASKILTAILNKWSPPSQRKQEKKEDDINDRLL